MSDNLPWLRFYTEAVDDEKLRLLAFEDRWHFVAILCCKGQGILDEDNDSLLRRKVAVKLGVQVRELEEIARRLAEVGLIDQETFQPCGWDKRQFGSDNSTDRVRRYREKQKKQADTGCNIDETLQKRPETVSVTPPDTDTDTDTEAETEREPRKKRARSATRLTLSDLPDDWRGWAKSERPDLDVEHVWLCFRDYWLSKGEARADWNAAWRNWVRRESVGGGSRPAARPTLAERNRAELDAWLGGEGPRGSAIEGEFRREH